MSTTCMAPRDDDARCGRRERSIDPDPDVPQRDPGREPPQRDPQREPPQRDPQREPPRRDPNREIPQIDPPAEPPEPGDPLPGVNDPPMMPPMPRVPTTPTPPAPWIDEPLETDQRPPAVRMTSRRTSYL